ncbi:hypothetical protein T01_7830 [Trichinella spiralis]|uniref:Uncharacterized protein n=1 Tax=Trichinella spiralis TaxID=6334 RepID=A0A0V1BUJ3_TRISP|nr:hypothetical protein T01_7830 [Trichinella spiralis]
MLKRRQSEIVLIVRLFRPSEVAQSNRLRNQADFLIVFRDSDAESGQEKSINTSQEGGGKNTTDHAICKIA